MLLGKIVNNIASDKTVVAVLDVETGEKFVFQRRVDYSPADGQPLSANGTKIMYYIM